MPRPGLIVGLGGTGQWVLTWLKRDLLLSNGGKMPDNVKLLEIDTCTQLEASASRVTAKGDKEEAAEVGGVTLDKSEYLYIGGSAYEFAKQIKERQDQGVEEVCPWFQASKWLSTQSPRTFVLDEGAGRLRQFGRLAIFRDLQGEETGSKIWRALRTAIQGVRTAVTEERSLEIIVVGSFAGGTGSGLFIDVALILRLLAHQLGVPHILRGMFALPGVFTSAPDEEMKARSFAAWRELNRFMVVDPDFPMPEIKYAPRNPKFRIQPDKRLFDACYLVDGKRKGQSIAQEAKYGVFPMLAETLSAILDEKAGTAYTEWVTVNLAPEYAKRPDVPMYSAVGAYTVQVPAYFVQEESSYLFGKEILLKLLMPRSDPDEEGRLIAAGAARHLALAAPDRNQEDRGFPGRARCLRLLSEEISYGDKSVKPTLFHSRIRAILDEVDQNRRQSTIELLARGGTGPASWVAYFPDLGDDPRFEAIRKAVNEHMRYSIVQQYRRREGEKEEEARARFRKIPEDLRIRFGGVSVSGEETEEFRGTCGDALEECSRAQMTIFRDLVRLRLLDMLNGHTDDALIAKSGKLGYAWDYFDGLVSELDRFLGLMADVKKRREELKPELRLAGLSKRAQDYLNATAGKKFLFWEHPNVRKAELAYLNAQQRLMEIRREDILHFYVTKTAREMKAVCEEARDALQRWIWHLATGDSPSQLPGMWDELRRGLQELHNAHSYDTASPRVRKLVADAVLPVDEEDIRKALKLWEWDIAFDGNHLEVQAHILPQAPEEPIRSLKDPTQGASAAIRLQIGLENKEALLGVARRRFMGIAARTTVAEEIKRLYPDPEKFVEEIADVSAEPLFEGNGTCAKKSNLIRVMIDDNDPYFVGAEGVEGILRARNQVDRERRDDDYVIQVVGSEHPYKLTLMRTDDLYAYDAYKAWRDGLEAYKKHIAGEGKELNPAFWHNFTAEIEAVKIEQRLGEEGAEYRSLHPRVVMLLEDRRALEQFVRLYMLGFIKESPPDDPPYRWQLTWKRGGTEKTIWLTKGWKQGTSAPKPDILSAMHGYVIVRKTRKPGRADVIDLDFADIVIAKKVKQLGRQGEMALLKHHLEDRKGLVQRLKRMGFEYTDDDTLVKVKKQEYVDLADVVMLILQDRQRILEEAQRREEEEHSRIVMHPRIAQLLGEGEEALERLRQFVYLGMLKKIKGVGGTADDPFRWQLTWQTKRGEQVLWLTPPWKRGSSEGPMPDILDAMYGYVVVGKTQEPLRLEEIDYELAQQIIDSLDREEEIEMIRRNLEPDGLIGYLRKKGDNPETPEYKELADMLTEMLKKRLDALEAEEGGIVIDPFA